MYIGALMPPSPIRPMNSPCPIHSGQDGPKVEIARPRPIISAPNITVQRVPMRSAMRPITMPPMPEPSQASALAGLGSGIGGIVMGRIADRIGTRWTVMFGALMIGLGLAISTFGPSWPLWIGHGLFIGLIGLGGINAPMYIYVSRWFDRRRGSALALISSGSYLAGALWPPVFERMIAYAGWRQTMLWYAALEIVVIVPLAAIYFRHPPEVIYPAVTLDSAGEKARVLGWPPNTVFALMCGAAVLCCIPMAM